MDLLNRRTSKWSVLALSIACLMLSLLGSIAYGQYVISSKSVWTAFWAFDPQSIDHVIIRTTRLSRALVACLVGAALAVAGVLMQALTRNPLASPSIFGVNAGAVFAIVLFSTFFSVTSLNTFLWLAFLGASVAGALVYGLGSLGKDGLSPVRIVLSGAAISALFMAFTQGILVIGQEGLDSVLFWVAGSVSGRDLSMVMPLVPAFVIGMVLAMLAAPQINILLSGDDIAKGLGQNTVLIKVALSLLIIGLAGGSVALGGSIGFIGLMVPHMVRSVVGYDHKWLIPLSALWGAILLLCADVISRFVIMPEEVPIGVTTAILGAPFFIYLARKGGTRE
ncbi:MULTISPECIES: FecCD family ABC transporter permease [Marinomonas]|uniref:Iron ABC transporter permease n=1 Tax=Marinomonas arctica TaxID=383750 RepID=A0A7H1J7K7_9GAMM|nr:MULTISPECIES: iron ABC transporter permease [Marinomonas]MCS7488411.1 siderophore ABC transporter permease [Marinomonas sp. BSi20414]QNT06473.1 iron ABC transporter permease [Marinomonas arctica]GGN38418.1 siderophore ABC transporter permease [Marinomonas arctica]